MNIHQLSVNYVGEQDRILVRINTTAGEELRMWLTRRLVVGLWPLLGKVVADQVAKTETLRNLTPTADDQTKKMLTEFKKEETLQQSDFKTPYKDQPAALPLGAEPLLVTEVNLTPLPSGQLQINFQEKVPQAQNPRAFQVALESQLSLGLLHLIETAVSQSQWNIATTAAPALAAPAVEEGSDVDMADKPKYLN